MGWLLPRGPAFPRRLDSSKEHAPGVAVLLLHSLRPRPEPNAQTQGGSDAPRLSGPRAARCDCGELPGHSHLVCHDVAAGTVVATKGDAERGRYLAERVAMCVECHSERDAAGTIIPGRKYMGGPIPTRPSWAVEWADRAPRNGGLPGYDDAAALRSAHARSDCPRWPPADATHATFPYDARGCRGRHRVPAIDPVTVVCPFVVTPALGDTMCATCGPAHARLHRPGSLVSRGCH